MFTNRNVNTTNYITHGIHATQMWWQKNTNIKMYSVLYFIVHLLDQSLWLKLGHLQI